MGAQRSLRYYLFADVGDGEESARKGRSSIKKQLRLIFVFFKTVQSFSVSPRKNKHQILRPKCFLNGPANFVSCQNQLTRADELRHNQQRSRGCGMGVDNIELNVITSAPFCLFLLTGDVSNVSSRRSAMSTDT
ncbi:unnamed protein product [Ixodes pacificus]